MNEKDIHNLKSVLEDKGYRLTQARETTFRALISPEPQSMSQVIEKTKGLIDRVSVYRNVDLFEKLGVVYRVYIGWKYKLELSDDFIAHHHHLSCLKCGKVIDIDSEIYVTKFIDEIASKTGFKPRRHIFEIDGYCKDCQ